MSNTVSGIHLTGLDASKPGAGTVTAGTIYFATDTGKIYRSDGASWSLQITGTGTGNTAVNSAALLYAAANLR